MQGYEFDSKKVTRSLIVELRVDIKLDLMHAHTKIKDVLITCVSRGFH